MPGACTMDHKHAAGLDLDAISRLSDFIRPFAANHHRHRAWICLEPNSHWRWLCQSWYAHAQGIDRRQGNIAPHPRFHGERALFSSCPAHGCLSCTMLGFADDPANHGAIPTEHVDRSFNCISHPHSKRKNRRALWPVHSNNTR